MTFGDRIRSLREDNEWERIVVSKMLNMPYTTYVNYETDQREPKHYVLLKIADLYKVSTDYLLGRTQTMNYSNSIAQQYSTDRKYCTELEMICSQLNDEGQKKIVEYAEDLITISRYKKGTLEIEEVGKQAG